MDMWSDLFCGYEFLRRARIFYGAFNNISNIIEFDKENSEKLYQIVT
jgi:hypothetical protein